MPSGLTENKTPPEQQHLPLLIVSTAIGHQNDTSIPFADDPNAITSECGTNAISNQEKNSTNLNNSSSVKSSVNGKEDANNFEDHKMTFDEASTSHMDGCKDIISRNLRRNSISLPSGINAIELEALRLKHQMQHQETLCEEEKSASGSCSEIVMDNSFSSSTNLPERIFPEAKAPTVSYENEQQNNDDDSDSDAEWKPKHRDRFRNRRRASIAPLPALRLNSKEMLASDFDTHSVASNQASITSVNSIASLLREKIQAFPQMIRKKKRETKDYKIKIFVIILFFMIIFLVGYAYVAYHQQILTRSYFDKIKFNTKDRILHILNYEEKEVISGKLGTTLGWYSSPFHCLEDHRKNDGSVCVEWNGVARLYMNFENMDVFRCYTIKWQALSDGDYPTDCYELSRGFWFGGGITKTMDWTLNSTDFDFSPYASGDVRVHQFGNAVKRYFLNSIGVAIQVSPKTPLQIAVNRKENRFCIRAMNDDFTFVNRLTPYPELDYKICTTDDMRSLHMLMTQTSLWDGLTENDIKVLNTLIEEPIWKIPFQSEIDSVNETTVYNYSEEIIAMGFMRLGHILVNEFWQVNIGDFTVDQERFPTLTNTINVLHRRGFKIVFTIQPFISTESPNFKDAVEKKLLIYERHSERSIPALTRYKSSSSVGVLDITNDAAIPWLHEKLKALQEEYKIDSFYLDLGTGANLPHYYQCRQTLENTDAYAKLFTSSLEDISVIGVSTASVVPRPPTFLSTPPTNSSWEGLREVILTIMNYGVSGYPFVLPGAIGGDYFLDRKPSKMISFYSLGQPELPEQELFLRWLQLLTFMPAMQFSHLPSEYKSDYITNSVKDLMNIRQKMVIPLLKKYLSDSMNEGLPLVRPLWMLDPHDPACLFVSDEFSVGEELIVAPILQKGSQEREVYLPQGVWKDGIDGSLRKGSRWIHNYKVPIEKIAFFIKMPDNTRF